MLPTEQRKLRGLLTSPQGGPEQHRCNRDAANHPENALPAAFLALPETPTCKKLLCNRRCLTPSTSNTLEMASRCSPAPQLGGASLVLHSRLSSVLAPTMGNLWPRMAAF